MTRLSALTTATLTAIIGVLVGVLLSIDRPVPMVSTGTTAPVRGNEDTPRYERVDAAPLPAGTSINFADIAARLNPAVVNIDATARGRRASRLIEEGSRRGTDDPIDPSPGRRNPDAPRREIGRAHV